MSNEIKNHSDAWYILPIFFTIIGGIIAYYVIKDDDPKKAKNCLVLGILLTVITTTAIFGFAVVGKALNQMPFD